MSEWVYKKTFAEELANAQSIKWNKRGFDCLIRESKTGWRLYIQKTPKENPSSSIKKAFGRFVDGIGIECSIIVEIIKDTESVYAIPTRNGRESVPYKIEKSKIGDDWFRDITNTWNKDNRIPDGIKLKMRAELSLGDEI